MASTGVLTLQISRFKRLHIFASQWIRRFIFCVQVLYRTQQVQYLIQHKVNLRINFTVKNVQSVKSWYFTLSTALETQMNIRIRFTGKPMQSLESWYFYSKRCGCCLKDCRDDRCWVPGELPVDCSDHTMGACHQVPGQIMQGLNPTMIMHGWERWNVLGCDLLTRCWYVGWVYLVCLIQRSGLLRLEDWCSCGSSSVPFDWFFWHLGDGERRMTFS